MIQKYIYPKKSLGQNFLRDKNVLKKIIAAADLKNSDIVLEVGPGEGILTEELAKRAGFVVAVEKDRRCVEFLKQKFAEKKNVEIVEGDILKCQMPNFKCQINDKCQMTNAKNSEKWEKFKAGQYKIVANLPYYITSHFLRLYLEGSNKPRHNQNYVRGRPPTTTIVVRGKPKLMVLMVQKEVAQRICAKNGQATDHSRCGAGQESLLSLSVKYYGNPHILAYVSRNSFFPVPKVDSAILKIDVFDAPAIKMADEKLFFWLIHATFASKRKQILGSLARKLGIPRPETQKILESAHILSTARPENLRLTDWQKLTEIIHNSKFAPFVKK